MDKKIVIAFVVSFLIIFSYPHYLKLLSKQPIDNEIQQAEVVEREEIFKPQSEDVMSEGTIENEELFTIENEKLKVYVSNYGASIRSIYLKEYAINHGDSGMLPLFHSAINEKEDLVGMVRIGTEKGIFINDYKSFIYNKLEGDKIDEIVFVSPPLNGLQLKKTYTLEENQYAIKIETELQNNGDQKEISIEYCSALDYQIKNRYDKHFVNSTINSYDKLIATKIGKITKDAFSFHENIDWLALEEKYFTVIMKPDFEINNTRVISANDTRIMGYIQSKNIILESNEAIKKNVFLYAGPKEQTILKAYNQGFENILSRGFFGGLKTFLLMILNFFYRIFNNYGFSIIILTILIKILFSPLTHKSFQSMRKMQELQPQMKALQEKYKSNPQQLNKEVMGLYKKHKANPFGGCLPILFQMPIFISLYQTLSRSVELRGAHFIWWIKDLSEPDKLFIFPFSIPVIGDSFNVLPLLMMGSMVWQQKLTPSATSKEQEKIMLLMPILFGVMFYSLPSGLVLYWFVNNILTIAHQLIMKKRR